MSSTQQNQPRRPDLFRGADLLLVIIGTLLAGIGLWLILPRGFATDIVDSPILLANMLLLYPLVEEWLFRGVIQRALLDRPSLVVRNLGISRANLITSILFVCLHLINHPPAWALLVLVPSLALGHVYERYQSISAPILLHITFNTIYLIAGNL